ncbi:hypothetical protein CCACVL1_02078 [Corchorus capsularis]|uniref:Uncharacterized protein n=1 Tax=Corchorus capsularis TaxID=210143 RepID=A0A1R3KD70_COCAP|nr:hypothetical protein CCACVL1_02078 [Corchorus capsularis]
MAERSSVSQNGADSAMAVGTRHPVGR